LALLLVTGSTAAAFGAPVREARVVIENGNTFGTIRGIVRDEGGGPIADATVAIFRAGTSQLLKQVSSAGDGSFLAKIIPGSYTVLAVAQGFNPVTIFGVEVGRSADLTYGFKLERAGSGNTVPDKRADKNSSKWRIRAAQSQRSIYQNREGKVPVVGNVAAEDLDAEARHRRTETVVETYFADGDEGAFAGINFATLVPLGENSQMVFAAQTGKGVNAPQRLETSFRFQPVTGHNVKVGASVGKLGSLKRAGRELGQVATQATDEWRLRNGVILVVGLDYARFIGAGNDSNIAPRLGLQFDIDPKTRFRAAYTTQTEERSWARAAELEGESFAFTEPVSVRDLLIVSGKPQMNKSRRVEFGIERVLDASSSIEAGGFFDTTFHRGVGLTFDGLDDTLGDMVADEHGESRGIRVIYQRRLNGPFSASAGYSFGLGQQISPKALTEPSKSFDSGLFHSFFAQLVMDLKSGTTVRTVFRLSPEATVFAIDPFKGRLAIYDPGLSVYVTQSLPTLGLPIKAQAIVDARNMFDSIQGFGPEEGNLTLTTQRRMVRGGIQVRF
jgi:hypothetical protein